MGIEELVVVLSTNRLLWKNYKKKVTVEGKLFCLYADFNKNVWLKETEAELFGKKPGAEHAISSHLVTRWWQHYAVVSLVETCLATTWVKLANGKWKMRHIFHLCRICATDFCFIKVTKLGELVSTGKILTAHNA